MKEYSIEDNAGAYTQSLIDDLWGENYDAVKLLEQIKNKEAFRPFNEGLDDAIQQCGYKGNLNSLKDKTNFVLDAVKATGGTLSRPTINDWFKGERRPKCNAEGREKMFILCFALKMNIEQIYCFFTKVFYEQPFNFRNSDECIYYYCIRNNLTYKDSSEIIKELDEQRKNFVTEKSFDGCTVLVRNRIDEFKCKEELIKYLLLNVPTDELYFQTARSNVKNLRENAIIFAKKYCDYYDLDYRKGNGTDFLLKMIYGELSDKKLFKTENKDITEVVKKNFPNKENFSMILDDKEKVTADMIRKCIILLVFYIMAVQEIINEEDGVIPIDKFVTEADNILDECGFQWIYPLNPYDRIFISCIMDAEGGNSLDNFQNFIGEISEG